MAAKKAAAKKKPAAKKAAAKKPAAKKAAAKKPALKKPAVKKPAAAKRPRPVTAEGRPVRGAALVELAIAAIEGAGARKVLGHAPEGLSEEALAKLTFPGGKPLPPSLRRWLAYDARWLDWFADLTRPSLPVVGFHQMMVEQFDEQMADVWDFSDMLPEHCYCVPGGSDSRRFLYVGQADEAGEYPILLVDTDDVPFVCVEYPGFDVYLASTFDAIELRGEEVYSGLFSDPLYGPAMVQQARLNLHGFKCFDHGGGDTAHVDGARAANEAMRAMDLGFARAGEDDDF